jgi:hypothetical protein
VIVKVQRSLQPVPDKSVLVYNKSRSVLGQLPMTPKILALFGDRLKFYCRAKIDKEGVVELAEEVDNADF